MPGMALLIAAAITLPQQPEVPVYHFDRIDLNHVHDAETGRFQFDQLIFWKWNRFTKRYHSFGFKSVAGRDKDKKWVGSDLEPRLGRDGKYFVTFKRNGRMVTIKASIYIRHWSYGDPERDDRNSYPDIDREW